MLGIMAQKWRVLRSVMLVGPEKATTIVLAIMTLQNFLCKDSSARPIYMPLGSVDVDDDQSGNGNWRQEPAPAESWLSLPPLAPGLNCSLDAKSIRDEFCDYVNLEGAVSWQWCAARIDA